MIYTSPLPCRPCVNRYVPAAVKAEAEVHHIQNIAPSQECNHADCDCAKVWYHSLGDRQYTRLEVGTGRKIYWFHGQVTAMTAVSWLHENNMKEHKYVKDRQVQEA